MQATLPLKQRTKISEKPNIKTPASTFASCAALDEIHAYLAARDLFLRQAEENPTDATLDRAWAANEFAEACLRPARSPYQDQSLPEADAARQRDRSRLAEIWITELRARLAVRQLPQRRAA